MSGIIQYLPCCDGLISLSIMSSRVMMFDISRLEYIDSVLLPEFFLCVSFNVQLINLSSFVSYEWHWGMLLP